MEQAQAAAGLDAKRTEAERLAAEITRELRSMDRRVATLIEQERRREEARQRASFARFMDTAKAKGLPVARDGQASPAARKAVAVALAQLGSPYRWGAEAPSEFDCSGLTSFAYAAAGVTIPRVSRAQFAAYARARPVDRMQLVAGDLVFFADDPRDPGTIHHVGMDVGRGLMVEAPYTGAVVRTSSIWRSSYAAPYARRHSPPRPGPPAPTALPGGRSGAAGGAGQHGGVDQLDQPLGRRVTRRLDADVADRPALAAEQAVRIVQQHPALEAEQHVVGPREHRAQVPRLRMVVAEPVPAAVHHLAGVGHGAEHDLAQPAGRGGHLRRVLGEQRGPFACRRLSPSVGPPARAHLASSPILRSSGPSVRGGSDSGVGLPTTPGSPNACRAQSASTLSSGSLVGRGRRRRSNSGCGRSAGPS